MQQDRAKRMKVLQENIDVLRGLHLTESGVIAQMGRLFIILPEEFATELRPHIGEKLCILRVTDTEYRWRPLHTSQKDYEKVISVVVGRLAADSH